MGKKQENYELLVKRAESLLEGRNGCCSQHE